MRKNPVDRFKEKTRKEFKPVEMTLEGLARLLVAGHLPDNQRRLNPTQWDFICSPHRLNMYMGRAGASKTSTLVAAGILQLLFEAGTCWLIGRRDYNDLKDTTMKRFFQMMDLLPPGMILHQEKAPPMKLYIRPVVGDVPSEVTFMGLSDAISGHEYDRVTIDEADEVEEDRIDELQARLRNPGGRTKRLDAAMNPPDKNSFWYTRCTGRNSKEKLITEPSFRLFRPVAGENDRNLDAGYYEGMRKTMGPERAQRLIDGEWGAIFDGQPVYRDFSRKLHVRRNLPYDPAERMFRFWDFGYQHPFCIWAQLDELGRLRALYEHSQENIEATEFGKQVIAIGGKKFPKARYTDFGDIAVRQKKDTGSTLQKLLELGIHIQSRAMNIEPSVDEVRRNLRQMVEGEPLLQFDEAGCSLLIAALAGGYRMDKKGEAPLKDGFYDHPADAYRYGVMDLLGPGAQWSDYGDRPDDLSYSAPTSHYPTSHSFPESVEFDGADHETA